MLIKMSEWIVKHPKLIIIVALVLCIPSAVGFIMTDINYDILSYLPEDLESMQGMDILSDFGFDSMGIIIMDGMTWDDMDELADNIETIENISSVLWLGSLVDSPIPVDMFPDAVANMLYSADGDETMMLVLFETGAAEMETFDAIAEIKAYLGEQAVISGMSAIYEDMMEVLDTQAPLYIAIAIILALAVLMITMESFVIPIVVLLALGIGIIYNMGTNIIFGEISFITEAIAAVLQLAVTLDYSVFLLDRYAEERVRLPDRHREAMARAIRQTFTSIIGSSLTTIFGFASLCFMSLTLGMDIGLVMMKGVLFGILTTIIILPCFILIFERLIYRFQKRPLVPSLNFLNKHTVKHNRLISVLFVILLIPCFICNQSVDLQYDIMSVMPDDWDSTYALDVLGEDFDMTTMNFLMVPSDVTDAEIVAMLDEIKELDGVSSTLSLASILGTTIPADILPDSIASMLNNGEYSLVMVNTAYASGTDELNELIANIVDIADSYSDGILVTGTGVMTSDLVDVMDRDFIVTNIISIAAIFILIAIMTRSIVLPIILVLSIECAIWLNMTISFVLGAEVLFFVPTIISCVQLGTTVDYAILLTNRYKEQLRYIPDRREAMRKAANASFVSIFQSAMVFFFACMGVYVACDIDMVRTLCGILARGVICSAIVILVFMPGMLLTFDKAIEKTTYGWKANKCSQLGADTAVEEFVPEVQVVMSPERAKQLRREEKERAKQEKKLAKAQKKNGPPPADLPETDTEQENPPDSSE